MSRLHHRRYILVFLILVLVLLSLVSITWAIAVSTFEFNLNPGGRAYEVFQDSSGQLWISDWGAGEIWRIDPINQVYIKYQGISGASDAKIDANGDLWWTDSKNNDLGRLDLDLNTADIWALSGNVSQTVGLALDPSNNAVWTTDEVNPIIHRFKPDTEEMCAYEVPDGGASTYILANSGRVWIGDWINNRIVALDPTIQEFEIFYLPKGNNPNLYGIVVDNENHIWWADQYQNFIGRLSPSSKTIITYTIGPSYAGPTVLATDRERIWVSTSIGWIARLTPEKINKLSTPITTTVKPANVLCNEPVVRAQKHIASNEITDKGWTIQFIDLSSETLGWLYYQLPVGSDVWGITASGQDVFIVDWGRQKLIWFKPCFELNLSHIGEGTNPVVITDPSPSCPAGEYLPETEISLEASPATGSGVVKWLGTNPGQLPGLTSVLTMPADRHEVTVIYGPNTHLPFVVGD